MRGAHQIGFRAGRVRFIGSRWQGLRFPSPFPSLPPRAACLSPTSSSSSSRLPLCRSHRRLFLHAGADQRAQASEQPASPCPVSWATRGSVCPRLASPFSRRFLAGGRWATGCRPAHAVSVCSRGLGALDLPRPVPSPLGNRESYAPESISCRRDRPAGRPSAHRSRVASADGCVCFLCRCSAGRTPEAPWSWLRRAYVIRGGGRSWVQAPLGRRRRRRRRGCLRRRRIGGTICTGRAAGTTAAGATRSFRPHPRRRAGGTRRTTRRLRHPCGTMPGPRRAVRRRRPPQVGLPPANPQI